MVLPVKESAVGVALTVTGEEAKLTQPEAVAVAVIEFVATKAGETVIVHEVPLAVPDPICDAPAQTMIPAPDTLVPLNDVVPAQIVEVVITGAAGVAVTVNVAVPSEIASHGAVM